MEITGTVYRAAFGAAQDPAVDPLTWVLPENTILTVESDTGTPIGHTDVLSRDSEGTITADIIVDTGMERWVRRRPYLWPVLDEATPPNLVAVGVFLSGPDGEFTAWAEV